MLSPSEPSSVIVESATFVTLRNEFFRLAHVKTTSDKVVQALLVTKASIPEDGSGLVMAL